MQSYLNRASIQIVLTRLKHNPVACILGPRQCGKSTLAKNLIAKNKKSIYLDLEKPSDVNQLQDAESFFKHNRGKLICLDEIQRVPHLFEIIRSIVDETNANSQFLLLGSASMELIQQSSETLAGRISYIELTPFQLKEVQELNKLWVRGGFPRSFLAGNEKASTQWRNDFIQTFLERDLRQLGFNLSPVRMRRFWQMLAHSNAQIFNASKLSQSLGVSYHTIQSYLELFEHTFMIRVLKPLESNLKKRLIKSPKILFRDSGILHSLLEIENRNALFGHPGYGGSWETFAIENIISNLPDWRPSYYRTATGNEIDLILEKGQQKMAIELKVSSSPQISKGFYIALADLGISEAYVIAPVVRSYPLNKSTWVMTLADFLKKF